MISNNLDSYNNDTNSTDADADNNDGYIIYIYICIL